MAPRGRAAGGREDSSPALVRAVDYAVAYAAHVWPVLPIKPGEKLPLATLVHRGFLDATTDRAVIERWWTRVPGAGIGIAVGMAGLVAVDIDPRNGGDVSALPFDTAGTLHAQTGGGGEHILYRVPQGFEPVSSIWKGIDLKWNGYIVVEPTVHPSGRAYAFVDWDVLSGVVPDIAEAPPELLRRIGAVAEAVSAGAEVLTASQLADLRATLSTIDPSLGRDDWVKIALALSTVAEHGFAIWDEWSQRSPKYEAAESRRVWASIDPAKLKPDMHWRWVFKHAGKYGGQNVSTTARRVRDRDEPPPPPSDEAPAESRAEGGEGARERAPRKRKPLDLGRFHELMERFVLIYSTDTAYDGRTRRIVRVANLRIAFGSDVVKLWLADPERRMILPEQLVFDPGGDGGDECINLFDGLAMEPAEGDPAPILELLAHLCADSAATEAGVDTVVKWVLDWLAYPLQNPGAKMASALVFHGGQGAGKNLFFEAVASIYGKYGLVVGQDQLEDKFNDWASQKLFLIGDEVVAKAELYHQKNKLKSFITGDTIQINAKMLPLRTEKNHVNVVFLSNEQQPLALEPDDRRYMVVYTPPRGEESLYQRVGAFLKAGGAARLLRFLLDRDLGDFSPHTRPIMTRAKADLIELGLKPPERFVREWLGGYLPLPLQVCASEQLYRAFRHWCQAAGERFPPPQVVFSKALDKAARGRLRAKVIKLDAAERGKLATRMWVPDGCAPPEGVTAGQWATDAVGEFERVLRVFCRGPGDDE